MPEPIDEWWRNGNLIIGCFRSASVSGNFADRYNSLQIQLQVITESSNRYRVSAKLTMVRVGIFICLFAIIVNIIREFEDNLISITIIPFLFAGVMLTAIYYYISNLKRIDYDDIRQTLYIVDTKSQSEIEVPVENIDKILYSSFGGRANPSYVIFYRDFHNQQQKVRLFPILFDNSIATIKTDTEFKNPHVIIKD